MSSSAAKKPQVVGYARRSSTNGPDDPNTSIERQKEAIAAYAVSRGWELVETYVDEGVSGSDKGLRLDRPGLVSIREHFGKVDYVVVSKLDRLARSVVDFMTFAEECKRANAALVSINDSLDLSTPNGRFVAQILASFAEMEAATITERVLAGIKKTKELGRWAGGTAPFGYKIVPNPNGDGKVLDLHSEHSQMIHDWAQRVLDGESLWSICKELNSAKVPTPRGGVWRVTTIRKLLTSTAVQGYSVHKGKVMRDDYNMPLQVFPAVLSPATVALLEKRFEKNTFGLNADTSRQKENARLLSGLLTCAKCGSRMKSGTSSVTNRKTKERTYVPSYNCTAAMNGVECSGCSIRAQYAEEAVEESFLNRFGKSWIIEFTETATEDVELAELAKAREDLMRSMWEAEDPTEMVATMARLKEREKALQAAPKTRRTAVFSDQTYGDRYRSVDNLGKKSLLASVAVSIQVGEGIRGASVERVKDRVVATWKESDTSTFEIGSNLVIDYEALREVYENEKFPR